MSVLNPKIPALISTALVCLALGAGGGMVVNQMYGPFFVEPKKSPNSPEDMGKSKLPNLQAADVPQPGGGGKGKGKGGFGGMGKGKGKGKGGMGMPPRPPSPRVQLASLVSKLDQLTEKPLTISLNDEQKAKLADQLKGLENEELSNEEANKRMNAILEIVEGQRGVMEAAGFTWPGSTPARPPEGNSNPFTGGEAEKHLKSLLERTGKAQK